MTRSGAMLAVFTTVVVVVGVIVVVLSVQQESLPTADERRTATQVVVHGSAVMTAKPLPATRQQTATRVSPAPKPTLTADSGCRLGKGTAALPVVPADVTDRVNRAWQRIETWLARYAPATAATLAPPADLHRIARAQQQIGVPIPAEVVASLLRHNGSGTNTRDGFKFPPFHHPLSVEGVEREVGTLCGVLGSSVDESVGVWWHGQFLPVAADFGGGGLFLDQRIGRGGRLGEFDHESHVSHDRWPVSHSDLLEVTATALETGGRVLGHCQARVTPEGALDWEIIR